MLRTRCQKKFNLINNIKLKPIYKIDYVNENNNEINNLTNTENYVFHANINKSLAEILEIPEFKSDENFIWKPPKEPGLSNCDYIINPYYRIHENIKKAYDIDYFMIIKDDIRNFRKLNEYQINYIKELDNESKDELLEIYNNCMNTIIDQLL